MKGEIKRSRNARLPTINTGQPAFPRLTLDEQDRIQRWMEAMEFYKVINKKAKFLAADLSTEQEAGGRGSLFNLLLAWCMKPIVENAMRHGGVARQSAKDGSLACRAGSRAVRRGCEKTRGDVAGTEKWAGHHSYFFSFVYRAPAIWGGAGDVESKQ